MDVIARVPERDWKEEMFLRDEWARFMAQWPWQFFLSLRLPERCSYEMAEVYLRRYREAIRDKAIGECAYMGVYNRIPTPHSHLLMLGFDLDRSHANVFRVGLKYLWHDVARRDSDIQSIHERDGVIRYITKRNTPHGHYQMVKVHGRRLLK